MANVQAERLLDIVGRHLDARQHREAEPIVASALKLDPSNVRGLCFQAIIAADAGHNELAQSSVHKALELAPQVPAVINNAACVFAMCGEPARAIEIWRRLIQLAPGSVDAYYNIAVCEARLGDPDAAEISFRHVLRLAPRHPNVRMNLADIAKNAGRIEEAVELVREGIRYSPNDPLLRSSLLYGLHFHPASTPQEIHRECAAWGRDFESKISASQSHSNDPSPGRKLRIGYLSPNFRDHSETYFVLPLFRGTDRSQFEIWAYSCNKADDDVTPMLRAMTDQWREVTALDDQHLAKQIRDDEIDVLVDLTMHMQGGRLGVFARRPAPVQVTWLAYPSTTGLTSIDYCILDRHLDPDNKPVYTERPYFLPDCYWCYEIYGPRPEVSELPADSNGYVTFGNQNHFGKVTRETLANWAALLTEVEKSRLLIHVGSAGAGGAVWNSLSQMGISRDRVTCQMRVGREEYLRNYQNIDIALDPYPYNGATTTCDALWMGLPVVSRAGETAVSRAGLSILSNLGLSELVADTWERYVQIAQELAHDRSRLRDLRSALRQRLERSPVMDAVAFATHMGNAYRDMWSRWCAKTK